MDTVTYPDTRVADFTTAHFVPVRIPVKANRALVEEFMVSWTPNVVIADDRGRVHFRIVGYLPPDDLVAHLPLGLWRWRLDRPRAAEAAGRVGGVARGHAGTDAGAAALYWLGVARYKATHEPAELRSSWDVLARQYPSSG